MEGESTFHEAEELHDHVDDVGGERGAGHGAAHHPSTVQPDIAVVSAAGNCQAAGLGGARQEPEHIV